VGLREQAIRPQTVEEIQALQRQATEEAKKTGYAEGLKQGLQEMKAKANQLQSIINFLQSPIEEMDQKVEYQLTELSLCVAKQLLRKECSVDEKHIQALIHESLDYLPIKASNIRVRLNPADIVLLNKAEINTAEQKWQCVADASVKAGGCLIESDTSHIDASLETRIAQLVEQLGLKSAASDDNAAD
jgi:flagellar assembly protein FliH